VRVQSFGWWVGAGIWIAVAAASPSALAQHTYKCGATFQDRPCATEDVQQRFSDTSGNFSIAQVNPDTDKDCAGASSQLLPLWQRMNAGERFEKLKAEVDARPISRYDKSQMRDALIALKEYTGTPKQVRSQLESQCMDYKRAHGMPTEREISIGASLQTAGSAAAEARARAAQDRVSRQAELQARAADERAARIEELRARHAAIAASQAAARAAAAAARIQTIR
jgi:hypothetical protein